MNPGAFFAISPLGSPKLNLDERFGLLVTTEIYHSLGMDAKGNNPIRVRYHADYCRPVRRVVISEPQPAFVPAAPPEP